MSPFRWVLLVLAICPLAAKAPLPLSPGYQHFYNLEYDEALESFRKQAAAAPNDPNPQNHIAQAILYREMFRVGALESEMVTGQNAFLRRPKMTPSVEDQKAFDAAINRAMDLCNARLQKDPKDIKAMYSLGVAYGMRSNYNWLVRKAWLDSLRDATQARKLHQKCTELDATFIDALLVQGVHDYVIGSLSWSWRMLGFLAGIHGDRDSGIRKVERVAHEGESNQWEAKILLAVCYRREKQPMKAIPLVQELAAQFPRNFLLPLELAQMWADAGNRDEALKPVNKLEHDKLTGAKYLDRLSLEKIHYFRGNILFWYRELPQALDDLKKAAAKAEDLDANSAAYTWLRLGQTLDLMGRREEARQAYDKVLAQWPNSDPGRDAKQYRSKAYRREEVNGG